MGADPLGLQALHHRLQFSVSPRHQQHLRTGQAPGRAPWLRRYRNCPR
jgi:hypothetical protein